MKKALKNILKVTFWLCVGILIIIAFLHIYKIMCVTDNVTHYLNNDLFKK